MATEKEASPESQAHPPDNGLQAVISPPAVVDPGGVRLSVASPPVPITPQPDTRLTSENTPDPTEPTAEKTSYPPASSDHMLMQADSRPTSQAQTIITKIIQANPHYTDSSVIPTASGILRPPDLVRRSVLQSEATLCDSSQNSNHPLSNTPSVIVLANSAPYSSTVKKILTQNPNNGSPDIQSSHQFQADNKELSRHTSYIPEAQKNTAPNSLDRRANFSLVSTPVTLEGANSVQTPITTAVINTAVSASGLLMNNSQIIYDSSVIYNQATSCNSQAQTNLSTSYTTSAVSVDSGISNILPTPITHSVITSHPPISTLLSSSPNSAGNPPTQTSQPLQQNLLVSSQGSQSPLLSLSNFVLANPIQQKELMMRSNTGTPPLSASDVLMSSFNVLEDGDPMHRYQVPAGSVSGTAQPHQQEYVEQTSSQGYTHWSDSALDHNRSAILKALKEPSQITAVSRRNDQAMLNLDNTQHNNGTVVSQQWVSYNEEGDSAKYTQMENAEGKSVIYTSMENNVLPPVSPSFPNTATDGPTTALKSAFAGAHFLCKYCPERFRIPEKLTQHIKRVHSGSVVYTCFTCGKKFYNSHDLREHVPTHANEPIKCSLCNLTLGSTKELRAHHKKAHPLSTISCPLCDKVFGSSSARAKHLREHQQNKQLTLCEHCGDPFIDKGAYEEHLKTHTKTSRAIQSGHVTVTSQRQSTQASPTVVIWKCDKCGQIFSNDSELNNHTSTVHTPQVVHPKTVFSGSLESSGQQGGRLNPGNATVPASKYELLRLLLRRRQAAGQAANAAANSTLQNSEYQGPRIVQNQHTGANQQDVSSRPPVELLSAEAMQHVAEELNMLQSMNQEEGIMDASLETPITADNIIDADSTMGINLTLNKNSSPASKVKEMQKHKTLVNMLQGTVASIIEREVKHPGTKNSASWIEESHQPSDQVTNGLMGARYSVSDAKTTGLEQVASYSQQHSVSDSTSNGGIISHAAHVNNTNGNELVMKNPQMIEQTSLPSQYTNSSRGNLSTNLATGQDVVQESAFHQELRSFLDMSQNIHHPSDVTQISQAQTLPDASATNKTSSSWDSHIGPLIKLFQNVNPEVAKISEGNQLPDHGIKTEGIQYSMQDAGIPTSREEDAILDLSSSRPNYGNIGSHPTQITSDNVSSGRLPHFNEVSWAAGREKNADGAMFETYTTYANPHSDLNQMSGGHLTYVQANQPQEPITSYYEHNIQGVHYVPSPGQDLGPAVNEQYVAKFDQGISVEDTQRIQTSEAQLQIFQDQHLDILNQHQVQQQPSHQDERLLLQEHQNMQHLHQNQPENPEGTQVQQGQFLNNPNDSFSQMLQDNNILNLQNEQQLESLPTHDRITENSEPFSNQNDQYLKMTVPNGTNNMLQNDGTQIIVREHHYMEPNNNIKQESEYQKLYEKFCKNTKPQYEGLRSMILARKFNPDVPLVVRHKLLATMLKEGAMDGELSPPKEPDSTTEGRPNGLISPTENLQGMSVPRNHQVVTTYQVDAQPLNDGSYSEHEKIFLLEEKASNKNRADETTVDHQLLSQMMSEMPPSSDMRYVQRMTSPKNLGSPPPLLPHPSILHPPVDLGARSEGAPPAAGNDILPSPKVATSHIADIQRRLSYEKLLGVRLNHQSRKKSKPCPAIHKNRITVVVQKAEDAFILQDSTVNVRAEKRKHSCEALCCRISKAAKQTPAKSRGRPPKNGQVPMKKGSYKKGQYPCPICNKVYAWKNYLRIHIGKHDKGVKQKGDTMASKAPDDDMPPLLPLQPTKKP